MTARPTRQAAVDSARKQRLNQHRGAQEDHLLQTTDDDLLLGFDEPIRPVPAPWDQDDDDDDDYQHSVGSELAHPDGAFSDPDATYGLGQVLQWNELPRDISLACNDTPPSQTRVFFLDVEFHWLSAGAPVSQVCVVSLDRAIVFNEYVFHRPLARDWMDLVRTGRVELAPWDDPARASTFDRVFERLLDALPADAVLVSKGTIDIARMRDTLDQVPGCSRERKDALRQRATQMRLGHASVDRLWEHLCTHLPPWLRTLVMSPTGLARAQHKVYNDLLWTPVLVAVEPTEAEQVARTPMGGLRLCGPADGIAVHPDVRCEFMLQGRQEPVWHTAHTDCLVTRNLTLLLLNFWSAFDDMQECLSGLSARMPPSVAAELHRVERSQPDRYAWEMFVTTVVRQTKWLRERDLQPRTAGAANTVAAWCHTEATAMFDVDLPFADPAVAKPRPDNANTVQRAREKRLAGQLVLLPQGDQWTTVPVPLRGGRDAFKTRALRSLLTQPVTTEKVSVFERIARALPAVGRRPWFFYPRATGDIGPHVRIMHSRACLDRKNGHAFGVESETSEIDCYDFDRMPLGPVPGLTLVFCKACKQYAASSAPAQQLEAWECAHVFVRLLLYAARR